MTSHAFLTLTFFSLLLGWLGLGAYAVGGRAAYDLRARRIAAARAGSSGRGLSRRALRRAATDVSMPADVAHRLAFEAGARTSLPRLRRRAASHRTEVGKWRRIEALWILAVVDERCALPLLEDALRADEDVAAAAGTILGGLGSETAARVFADSLGDTKLPDLRLAGYLDAHPRNIAPVVLRLAGDPEPGRRYWGVTLLSRYTAEPAALAALVAAAAAADANVRAAAAETLGTARTGGMGPLTALTRDPEWFVRAHAARALGLRGAPGLAEAVAPLLADANWWVRNAAKDALAGLGAKAEAAVAPYLDHDDAFARNGAVEVLERVGAVDAILDDATRSPDDSLHRRYARAIILASEDTFRAAVERVTPALRAELEALAEDALAELEEAA